MRARPSRRLPFVARLAVGLGVLALVGAPGTSSAQSYGDEDFARSGFYLMAAGLTAWGTSETDKEIENLAPGGLQPKVERTLGAQGRAGYRITPRFAAELHGEWLQEFEFEVRNDDAGTLEGWALTVNGKAYLLTGRMQPFVLAGIGVYDAEVNDTENIGIREEDGTGFAGRLGGGFEYYLSRNVVANLDLTWLIPTGDVKNLEYLSLGWGLTYRF